MFDINEIMKRAQQAGEQAADSMQKTLENNQALVSRIQAPGAEKNPPESAGEAEGQPGADTRQQVEILGQMFGPDSMAQMAVNEELLQKMVNEKVTQAAASTAEDIMGQLFGEDMGIIAAALETLETEDADDEDELPFDPELEQELYAATGTHEAIISDEMFMAVQQEKLKRTRDPENTIAMGFIF